MGGMAQWVALNGAVVRRSPVRIAVTVPALTMLAEEAMSHDHENAGDGRG